MQSLKRTPSSKELHWAKNKKLVVGHIKTKHEASTKIMDLQKDSIGITQVLICMGNTKLSFCHTEAHAQLNNIEI